MKYEIGYMIETVVARSSTIRRTWVLWRNGSTTRVYSEQARRYRLTKAASRDYARKGIRVNAVCPGVIDTTMMHGLDRNGDPATRAKMESWVPMNRYGAPQEVGQVVAFLCSDSASYITGQAIPIDGGVTS